MKIITKDIICKSETLTLSNQRAIFWQSKQALILSDLHIGKTAHFRKNGIPITSELMHNDLKRLKSVIDHFKPEHIIVVGDLFHAEYNPDVKLFQDWIQEFRNMSWTLVKGNHDKRNFQFFENTGIAVVEEILNVAPFKFQHDVKLKEEGEFYISGHTHPGVFIKGRGRQRIKLPCYQITENQIVLPAFSLFTGLNSNSEISNSKKYAFTDKTIIEVI
ncbi:MAG: ligase-associated DNA damage response endonuclease PdeM [Jejuia sp.]